LFVGLSGAFDLALHIGETTNYREAGAVSLAAWILSASLISNRLRSTHGGGSPCGWKVRFGKAVSIRLNDRIGRGASGQLSTEAGRRETGGFWRAEQRYGNSKPHESPSATG
jgi:hypothetical protein